MTTATLKDLQSMTEEELYSRLNKAAGDLRDNYSAKMKLFRESPDPIAAALKATERENLLVERHPAQDFLLSEGVRGNLNARRAFIEAWRAYSFDATQGHKINQAKDWLKALAKEGDRTATLILGEILFLGERKENWRFGRQFLLAAAFDPELVDIEWPVRRKVRELALLALFRHYSRYADGLEPNPLKAIWFADLSIGMGFRGALLGKAEEYLRFDEMPEAERKSKAAECLEDYLSIFDSNLTADNWPEGHTLPEVARAEQLLDKIRGDLS